MKPALRTAAAVLPVLLVVASTAAIGGCQTRQPGVKSVLGSQYAIVDASVEDTTEAAVAVLKEMGLDDVVATATEVDGEVTGFTKERTRVEVYAAQESGTHTEVSVMVGALGEAAVGTEIIAQIRGKLGS